MKVLVQRVDRASVSVDGAVRGEIGTGILALTGFRAEDTDRDLDWMRDKLTGLRIFSDPEGLMNLSLLEVRGSLLVVSQFTLHADTRKGKRPSFVAAAPPETAARLYREFLQKLRETPLKVEEGVFGAAMNVSLVNSGPVTLMLDSPSERTP